MSGSSSGGLRTPLWLAEYLSSRGGAQHSMRMRLEPFVMWLDGIHPAAADTAALVDLYQYWTRELGSQRTRALLEDVRDLYVWMNARDIPGARHRLALTDDFVRVRMDHVANAATSPLRDARPDRRLSTVAWGLGVMLLGMACIIVSYLAARPVALLVDNGAGTPLLPWTAFVAAGGVVALLAGFIVALLGVRRLGPVAPALGLGILVALALVSTLFIVLGTLGASMVVGMGFPAFAVPMAVFPFAGVAGIWTAVGEVRTFVRPAGVHR